MGEMRAEGECTAKGRAGVTIDPRAETFAVQREGGEGSVAGWQLVWGTLFIFRLPIWRVC